MAETVGLTEAATALRDHFGNRLTAGHDDGLDIMADALREHFGIDGHEARKLVDSLEKAHSIRWIEADPGPHVAVGTPDSGEGMGIRVNEAYWQL